MAASQKPIPWPMSGKDGKYFSTLFFFLILKKQELKPCIRLAIALNVIFLLWVITIKIFSSNSLVYFYLYTSIRISECFFINAPRLFDKTLI